MFKLGTSPQTQPTSPPKDSDGITHKFQDGVNVIAGINGLGKTTLLNILLRILVGPWDRKNDDDLDAGVLEIKKWRTPKFFSSRVPDSATDAEVTCQIAFGQDIVTITRKLTNLDIKSLRRNEKELVEPYSARNEGTYQSLIVDLSGMPDFNDFHLMTRHLLFYLEDRTSSIWSDRGQFELARIMFAPNQFAKELRDQMNEANKIDGR